MRVIWIKQVFMINLYKDKWIILVNYQEKKKMVVQWVNIQNNYKKVLNLEGNKVQPRDKWWFIINNPSKDNNNININIPKTNSYKVNSLKWLDKEHSRIIKVKNRVK